MREIRRGGDEVTIGASLDELRALVGALGEALNGGYAFPEDEWEVLVGQPTRRSDELLRALLETVERRAPGAARPSRGSRDISSHRRIGRGCSG